MSSQISELEGMPVPLSEFEARKRNMNILRWTATAVYLAIVLVLSFLPVLSDISEDRFLVIYLPAVFFQFNSLVRG